MRLILSRKGFDSGIGRCPSPIMPDSTMVSLPIPDATGNITYREMNPRGLDVGKLVEDLSRTTSADEPAHLDPDLDGTARARSPYWRPAFGQSRAAAKHLRNQGVGTGDLFLFFGWFRRVHCLNGCWRFVTATPDLHVLFGWLWVEDVIEFPAPPPPGLKRHPHFDPTFDHVNRRDSIVYAGKPVGGGVFPKFTNELQLTAVGYQRSCWRLPGNFYGCDLSYHRNKDRWAKVGGRCTLQTVGRGQEFVLDCTRHPTISRWAKGLIRKHGMVC
jgi:hypothetical protein